MKQPILYWYWTPNPQKIRLALEEIVAQTADHPTPFTYKMEHIQLGKGQHRTTEYRNIHPFQQVPALDLDAEIYWESGAALLALAEHFPCVSTPKKSLLYNLLFLETSVWQRHAGMIFWQNKIAPLLQKEPDTQAILESTQKLQPSLDYLETLLQEHGPFLLGEFSVADCAFAPWLPYVNLQEKPLLQAWLLAMQEKSAWKACGFR